MKTWKILALIMFIFINVFNINAQLNEEQAINLVTNQILDGELESINLYMLPFLAEGSNPLALRDGRTIILPYYSNWVFFVDEHPFEDWAHSCRFISIDQTTGEYQIITENFYPFGLYDIYEEIAIVPTPVIEPNDFIVETTVESAPVNPHLYAVLICPVDRDVRHWNHTSVMFTTLINQYGYAEENIFLHYAEGESTLQNYNDFNNDGIDDIDYNSRKITIQNTFKELAGITNNDLIIPQLSNKDQLFVFFTDHGNMENENSLILVQDTIADTIPDNYVIWDYELAEYLAPINCAQMVVVIQACMPGGFSRKLVDYNNYNAMCKNRIVHTSSDYTGSSTSDEICNRYMSEFIFHWQAAVRGNYSHYSDPWNPWHATDAFPFYQFYDVNPPAPRSPDLNSDGIVQLEETFEYADDFNKYSPYGFCRVNLLYEYPQQSESIAFKEDLLSLRGLGGDVSNTQYVEGGFLITSNLVIDNNATLTVGSNSSFHLYGDSKIIITEGSKLILGDDVLITREGTNEAIEVFGELVIGNHNLESDLIVKSNGVLTLTGDLIAQESTRVYLGNNTIVNGDVLRANTLTINGDINSLNEVTFNNISNGMAGEIIIDNEEPLNITSCQFNSSNLKGHLYFSDVDIEQTTFNNSYVQLDISTNASTGLCEISDNTFENIVNSGAKLRPALRIEDFPMFRITDNIFRNNASDGIAVYNSGNLSYPARSISNNQISDNTGKGMIIYASVADIYDNRIFDNNYGIAAYHNSNVRLYGKRTSLEQGIYQMIFNNEVNQVLAGEQSFPWYFTYNVIREENSTYPRVYSTDRAPSNPYNIERNCWGNNFNPLEDLAPLSYYDYLPVWDCGLNPGDGGLIGEARLAYETSLITIEEENYALAETELKTIVTTWPESSFAAEAMKTLQTVAIETNTLDELITYYNTNSTIQGSEDLAKLGGYLVADTKIIQKEYQDALAHYEGIISAPPTEEDYIYAVIDAGRVQYLMEEEGNKAPVSFKYSNLIPKTRQAYKENRRMLLDGIKGEEIPENTDENTPSAFNLSDEAINVYPNPVMDKATIELNVGTRSNVTIELLDVSGKLLKQVRCQTNSSGKLQYELSTAGIDNGVYFIKTSFNNNQRMSKIIVAK